MRPIIAIRPEPGLSSTLALGRELGLAVTGVPLFEIRPLEWQLPDPATIDALLIGSANAFLGNESNLARLTDKPVYAVGKTTADAARDAGFAIAAIGSGGLQNVLDQIATPTRLLRIAGAERVPLSPPAGVTIETVVAYESAPLPVDPDLRTALSQAPIVLLHSVAAARHFASECKRLGIDPRQVELAALGPRIVEMLDETWRAIHVSSQPTDRDLLEMVRNLCE
ncbi:MAG: uroporphyrinogen-III synthase [Pseudomonadota bacterium]